MISILNVHFYTSVIFQFHFVMKHYRVKALVRAREKYLSICRTSYAGHTVMKELRGVLYFIL